MQILPKGVRTQGNDEDDDEDDEDEDSYEDISSDSGREPASAASSHNEEDDDVRPLPVEQALPDINTPKRVNKDSANDDHVHKSKKSRPPPKKITTQMEKISKQMQEAVDVLRKPISSSSISEDPEADNLASSVNTAFMKIPDKDRIDVHCQVMDVFKSYHRKQSNIQGTERAQISGQPYGSDMYQGMPCGQYGMWQMPQGLQRETYYGQPMNPMNQPFNPGYGYNP